MLDNAVLVRWATVIRARQAHGVSERRACSVLVVDRSLVGYCHRRGDDAGLRARLRDLAATRRRFGYRRLHVLLAREGITMNHKKLRRLYGEERLQVRRRDGRKGATGTRAPLGLPSGPNQRWSLDLMSDALGDGRRLMREHDFQPRLRRRFTATTDSNHDQPIFPNLAKDIVLDGPDQLWVADITYVTIVGASSMWQSSLTPSRGGSWDMPSVVPSTPG